MHTPKLNANLICREEDEQEEAVDLDEEGIVQLVLFLGGGRRPWKNREG